MSIMKTFSNTVESLASGNKIYADHQQRWDYFLEAYLGGQSWKDGSHLIKYMLETDSEYRYRLNSSHFENHCSSVISVYNSFLFREKPYRNLGSLNNLAEAQSFLRDADMDGTSLDNFMKDVATWSAVFGAAWVVVCKPYTGAATRADEMRYGVRPYLSLLTPLAVLDWNYVRRANGSYQLDYFRYVEDVNGTVKTIKEWTPDTIRTVVMNETETAKPAIVEQTEEANGLGYIPAVCAYNKKAPVRGIGISDLQDIADASKTIYNLLNELEQTIRLDSHPSLVCTPDTITGNGAGSIIHISENLDPQLKPYILDYNGASVDSILKSIEHISKSIEKMANIGSIRSTEAQRMSGVSQEQEFQLLSARLSEKADNLELTEEGIWRIFADYMARPYDCEIEYPGSFNIRDIQNEYAQLESAKKATDNTEVHRLIDRSIVELLGHEPDEVLSQFEPHVMTNPQTGASTVAKTQAEHEALMTQGYIHPEEVRTEMDDDTGLNNNNS
jgi:hypothetical protein